MLYCCFLSFLKIFFFDHFFPLISQKNVQFFSSLSPKRKNSNHTLDVKLVPIDAPTISAHFKAVFCYHCSFEWKVTIVWKTLNFFYNFYIFYLARYLSPTLPLERRKHTLIVLSTCNSFSLHVLWFDLEQLFAVVVRLVISRVHFILYIFEFQIHKEPPCTVLNSTIIRAIDSSVARLSFEILT